VFTGNVKPDLSGVPSRGIRFPIPYAESVIHFYYVGKGGKEKIMRSRNLLFAGALLLTVLSGCNLPGVVSSKATQILPVTSPVSPSHAVSTIPANAQPNPTLTPVTPTETPMATVNPLAIPRMDIGSAIDLTAIQMLDAQNGWGIGGPHSSGNSGHVFRTADGGGSWFEVTPPMLASSTSEVGSLGAAGFFRNADSAWVTYQFPNTPKVPALPVVWKTTDGGRTWQASSPLNTSDLNETYFVSNVFFASPSAGWILIHVGAGMNHDYVAIYRSTDGGANWSRVIDPYTDEGIQGCEKTGIIFSDGSNGWLTGNCNGVAPGALLFQTGDGGATWNSVQLPVPTGHADLFSGNQFACKVNSPFILGSQIYLGVECQDMSTNPGTGINFLYRSPVSGAGWNSAAYPGGDIITLDGNRIWALGKDIYRSEDAGNTWTKISTVTWDGQFGFVSSTLGFAIAKKDSGYGLVQTNDGGAFWALLNPVVSKAPGA
jgi:photosystem II stability/assembly factor-like uncharacterized protein